VSQDQRGALPINRIEALTDGVFAIAMTVIVLSLDLPRTGGSLAHRLWQLGPKLASYVLSFVMLGVLWIGHHYQLNHLRQTNRMLIWLNLAFLLAITFLPFGAAVLGSESQNPGAVVLYAGTILLAGVSLLAHWRYAMKHPELIAANFDPKIARGLELRILYGMGVTVASAAVAFIDTRLSLVVLLALPIGYVVRRSSIDRHVKPRT
jgi:uncharacterized membrane protein